MADNEGGGMFSKLINPDTAKPKITSVSDQGRTVIPLKNKVISPIKHSSTTQKPKIKLAVKTFERDIKTKKRRQISAYFTPEQLNILKRLYFRLNEGEGKIEKSEILGLAIETLSKLLGTQVPKYSSIYQVREYLDTQISKYSSTQVLKNSGT